MYFGHTNLIFQISNQAYLALHHKCSGGNEMGVDLLIMDANFHWVPKVKDSLLYLNYWKFVIAKSLEPIPTHPTELLDLAAAVLCLA